MEGALLLVLSFFSFLMGFLGVALYVSWQQAQQLLGAWHKRAPHWPHVGCHKVLQSWKDNPPCAVKTMPKLTQVEEINEELKKVMDLCMRDYFEKWYHPRISLDPVCVQQARDILTHVITLLATRSKQVDYLTYLVETIMEDFLEHFKRYKHACFKAHYGDGDSGSGKTSNSSKLKLIEEAFFDDEGTDNPWKAVCTCPEARTVYLRRVTEVMLYLFLPETDFSSPLLQVILTDVCLWQVWTPLLQTVIEPDNFNKTIIFMGKDSFLTPETFVAAINEGSTELELRSFQIWIQEEITKLQKTGQTGFDGEKLKSFEHLRCQANTMLQGEVKDQPNHNSSLLSFKVTIPAFNICHEGSNKHCIFELDVRCRHSHASVDEHWTAQRRFRDFQDIDLTLRNHVEHFPPTLSLPSLPTFNKLDPQRLEIRRQSLERYITAVTGDQFLKERPQAMTHIILFLTEGEFTRNTSQLYRKVDTLLKPLSSMKRSATAMKKKAIFTSMPNLPGSSSGIASAVSSGSNSPRPSPNSSRKTSEGKGASSEEDEDSLPVDMIMDLLGEAFDLSDKKWLLRQLPTLLKQLMGGKISRKVVQTADWLTCSQQAAQYLQFLIDLMWPGGYPPDSREPPLSEIKARRSLLARSKMIGSIPDELRRVLGNDSTVKGMARLWRMFQSESLNCCLALVLLEGLLDTLFPSRNVRETFRLLRIQISNSRE